MTYRGEVDHDSDEAGFEAGTGFLLARLGSLSERSWSGMLREFGLTPHQHGVLLALRERGSVTQQQLVRMIAVDSRNVVAVLDGLVEQGYLERRIDEQDRRRRTLMLTRSGQGLARRLADAAARTERDFLAGLPHADQVTLNRLLRALHATLIS